MKQLNVYVILQSAVRGARNILCMNIAKALLIEKKRSVFRIGKAIWFLFYYYLH